MKKSTDKIKGNKPNICISTNIQLYRAIEQLGIDKQFVKNSRDYIEKQSNCIVIFRTTDIMTMKLNYTTEAGDKETGEFKFRNLLN